MMARFDTVLAIANPLVTPALNLAWSGAVFCSHNWLPNKHLQGIAIGGVGAGVFSIYSSMFSDVPKLKQKVKELERTQEAWNIYFSDELGRLNTSNTTDVDVKIRALRVRFEGITKLNRTFEMCNKKSQELHDRAPAAIKESLEAHGVQPLDLSTRLLSKLNFQAQSCVNQPIG